MKRMLFLAYYFPPHGGGGVLRSVETVRFLEQHGWSTTVITGPENGYWVRDEGLVKRLPESTLVVRAGTLSPMRLMRNSGSCEGDGEKTGRDEIKLRRWRRLADWFPIPDVYFWWIIPAVRKALPLAVKADWIMSSSPPESSHLAAWYLARKTGARWVADFRDPWLNGIYRHYPTSFQKSCQRKLERTVVENADLVLATSEATVEDFRSRYPNQPEKKFCFIPNGFDPEEFKACQTTPKPGLPLKIIHAGNLTLERDPGPVFKAVAEINRQSEGDGPLIKIELAGMYSDNVRDAALELAGDQAVTFSGYLSRKDTVKRLKDSHLTLLIESFSPGAELIVPGKLYDCLGAGLPVLALAPEGAATRLIEKLGCGVSVTEPDKEKIKEVLLDFLQKQQKSEQLLPPPDKNQLSLYERPAIVKRLDDLLS